MNCLLFWECMSIQCCKNKARLLSRRIRTTKNHWSLKNLIFKGNIWHPGLENARDHVKSMKFLTNEIYAHVHQCFLSLLLCFILNFELDSCLRYIFIGKDFHA